MKGAEHKASDPDIVERLVGSLDPISLSRLDEQAALRKRLDTKYVISRELLLEVVRELGGTTRCSKIDGRRSFDYESVYFDTPDLRSFRDHVDGNRPRYKVRSRSYKRDAYVLSRGQGQGRGRGDDKAPARLRGRRARQPDQAGRAFIDDTLGELAHESAPADLAPSLSTRYRRVSEPAPGNGATGNERRARWLRPRAK